MKKIISFILIVLTVCSISLVGASAATAVETQPEDISITQVFCTKNSIQLMWDKQSDINGYQIQRYFTDYGWVTIKTIKDADVTSFVDKNDLQPGTQYKYRIRTFVNSWCWLKYEREYGNWSDAKFALTRPNKITGNSVVSEVGEITLAWYPVKCAGYEIQFGTDQHFRTDTKTYTTKKQCITFNELDNDARYYTRVRAYTFNDGNKCYGAWSSEISTSPLSPFVYS